jgi:hypothetical protein
MKRTGLAALAIPTSVLMATLWLAIACSSSPGTSTGPAQHSGAPGQSPSPVIDVTGAPSTTTVGTPVPMESKDPNAPPVATLSGGGAAVQGMTGSYCWTVAGTSACADLPAFTDSGPDLPVVTLSSADTQLQFSLADGYAFASWTASYVDDNGNVVALGGGGSSFDPDAVRSSAAPVTSASFGPPTAHDQSIVQVFVRFTDGGDASYGWNVAVP